jgi:DNA-binding transcriptional MerR regulator
VNSIKKSLENWLNELNNFSFKNYEELPDIDLYMDQVVTFLDKQLYIFQNNTLDKQITSSMINNYVKGEVLPSPISKKYNREHLALIEEICTLKQVLSIADVKQIEDDRYTDTTSKGETFNEFNRLNNEKIEISVSEAFKKLNDIDENDYSALIALATDFALTANAYINISRKILYLTKRYKDIERAKETKEAELQKEAKKDKKKKDDEE